MVKPLNEYDDENMALLAGLGAKSQVVTWKAHVRGISAMLADESPRRLRSFRQPSTRGRMSLIRHRMAYRRKIAKRRTEINELVVRLGLKPSTTFSPQRFKYGIPKETT